MGLMRSSLGGGSGPLLFLLAALVVWSSACAATTSTGRPAAELATEAEPSAALAELPSRSGAGAPIALELRSGADLPITQLQVRAFDRDPLVFTELRVVFERHEPRATRGRFRARLPDGARVVRFAVGHEGRWREAQVVPRSAGGPAAIAPSPSGTRAAAEDFEAELPHVPARGTVSVVLSYVETREDPGQPYRLALEGLPRVGHFDARLALPGASPSGVGRAGGGRDPELIELRRYDWVPRDIELRGELERAGGVRHGDLVALRVPVTHHDHAARPGGLTVLVDTSASRAAGFKRQIEELAALLEALEGRVGATMPLRVVAFDQGAAPIFEGPIGAFSARDLERLRARRALGASDLGAALYRLGLRRGGEYDRLLLVSDGQVTAGRAGSSLHEALVALAEVGYRRLDVLGDREGPPSPELAALVELLPERGLVLDGAQSPRALSQRLVRSVVSVRVEVAGAVWSYPERVEGVQAADDAVIFARLGPGAPAPGSPIELNFSDDQHPAPWRRKVVPGAAEAGLVEDAVASAQVASLQGALVAAEGTPVEVRRKAWDQIVALSSRHRLLNDFTRLAVLRDGEQPADAGPMLVAGPDAIMRVPATDPERAGGEGTIVAVPRLAAPQLEAQQLRLLAEELVEGSGGRSPIAQASDRRARAPARSGRREHLERPLAGGEAETDHGAARPHAGAGVRVGLGRPPARAARDAYSDNHLAIKSLLRWSRHGDAQRFAWAWREAEPESVLALVALGEILRASGDVETAARAYGSIIDLHPGRADLRRLAGTRLEGLDGPARRLARDSYRQARRLAGAGTETDRRLAYGLVRRGRATAAFELLAAALERRGRDPRPAAQAELRVLTEDLAVLAAVALTHAPDRRAEIEGRLASLGVPRSPGPSLRFVLSWDLAGTDVDLHVRDGAGGHAYYDNRSLRGGGTFYGDARGRQGMEAVGIAGHERAFPYHIEAYVPTLGEEGFAGGHLQIIEHDGAGGLWIEERPFEASRELALVDLGVLGAPLGPDRGLSPSPVVDP